MVLYAGGAHPINALFINLKQKTMYKHNTLPKTTIEINEDYEGERIEEKVERIMTNNEPISDGAPLIYTERKDGIMPEYNVKTDRWDVAIDAMDYVSKSQLAKREELKKMGEESKTNMELEKKTERKKSGNRSQYKRLKF